MHKRYKQRWVIRYMSSTGEIQYLHGYESKESLAIKKLFSLLEDKKFCLSVLDAYTYTEGGDGSVIHINSISKKVSR